MKTKASAVILMSLSLAFTNIALSESHPSHWGYEGPEAPHNWGKLSPDYALCDSGKNQSPVDIKGSIVSAKTPLKNAYHSGTQSIENNGHTIQINVKDYGHIELDGEAFDLRQFHFHAPSENQINDKSYPFEAHFVHTNAQNELLVLSVMFLEGNENTELNKAWANIPEKEGIVALNTGLDINKLLPNHLQYYRFSGSLTTPPCTEGVRWVVLKEPMSVSKAQIDAFRHAIHHNNNRPIQPLNGRVIIE